MRKEGSDMENVKGFKVFSPDWTCRGFQYEVGKVYEENVTPSVCDRGFHFCKQAKDCFNYYKFDPNNKVAEVIALGDIAEDGDKCCTNIIKIEREITWEEVLTIVNTGKACTGLCNSGNRNSGDWNSGNRNSGDFNSGDWNSGDWNSGDCNSGNRNSGDWNSGDWNSGNRNSGNRNSGDWNSGNRNSGDWNSGNRNSGDFNSGDCNSGDWNSGNRNSGNRNSGNRNSGNRNSGDWNSGDWNSGDWNKASNVVGCFNTENQKLRFFDKETDMTFEQWRNSEACWLMNRIDFRPADWIWSNEMSDAEKAEHPEHETTGGYLKIRDNTDCCKEWWNGLNQREKQVIMSIPNFDADKFFKITGVKVG
jgi:hypothetical protein